MADSPTIANQDDGAGTNAAEYTVSDLAGAIKRAVEDGFGHVRLRGEISGYRGPHASGHCYFTLKDERARIDAVIWRGAYAKLKVKPEDGMEVIAQGRVTTYPNSSKYQIVIETMEPAGVGALMALLEERKRRFEAEGLFADSRKRTLPFLPKVIGIITSPTGAVIRDMLHGFNERFPAHVVVWPVRVQGETSAVEVAGAIRGFNAFGSGSDLPRPDVLIVARGGGSLEDLWGFNEEIVVRAAAESEIPLISAVGHETDWTLIDLAADARAPTPTKAAEWAVPKFADLLAGNDDLAVRLKHAARRRLETARTNLLAATRGLPRRDDLVALPRQYFDALERRLGPALLANTRAHAMRLTRVGARLSPGLLKGRVQRAGDVLERAGRHLGDALRQLAGRRRAALAEISAGLRPRALHLRCVRDRERLGVATTRLERAFAQRTKTQRARLEADAKLLASLGYQSVLQRGYAIVRKADAGMVRTAAGIAPGDKIAIEFHDGQRAARIDGEATPPNSSSGGGRTSPPNKSPRIAAGHPEPEKIRSRPNRKETNRDRQGSLF